MTMWTRMTLTTRARMWSVSSPACSSVDASFDAVARAVPRSFASCAIGIEMLRPADDGRTKHEAAGGHCPRLLRFLTCCLTSKRYCVL